MRDELFSKAKEAKLRKQKACAAAAIPAAGAAYNLWEDFSDDLCK